MSFIKLETDPAPQLLISSLRTTNPEAEAVHETLSRLASNVDCSVKASFGSEEYKAKATRFLADTAILRRTQEMKLFRFGRSRRLLYFSLL